MNEKSDESLILEFKAGSEESFKILYERYVEAIHRFIYHMVKDAPRAEDLTQDVFLKVYNKAHLFKPTGKFSSWLYRIAKNTTLSFITRHKDVYRAQSLDVLLNESPVLKEIHELSEEKLSEPLKAAISKDEKNLIDAGLLRLKPKERQILILYHLMDLSRDEVAEIIGCSVGSLDVQLYRAKLKLAQVMGISDEFKEE